MGVPVTLAELILAALAVLFVFQGYRFKSYEWRLWPVLLFVLAAGISVWITPETRTLLDGTEVGSRMQALGILKGWVLAPLVFFVMVRSVFRDKASMVPFTLRALLFSGIILSLMALNQELTGNFLTPDGRASGPFESANYLSLYLGPIFVFAVLALWERFVAKKVATTRATVLDSIFLGFGVLVTGPALFFTESYAAWIAVFLTFLVAVSLTLKKKQVLWALGGLGLLALVALASQIGSDKFMHFFEWSERSSSSVRLQIYEVSLALIQSHPLLGIGLGQFQTAYQLAAEGVLGVAPFEWNMPHPHNIFLAFWLNTGLLGLIAIIWMLVKALPWLVEKDAHERHLAAFMLLVMIFHGFFDTPYFKNDLAFEWWLLMAILL